MKAGRGIWVTLVVLGLELGQDPVTKQGQFVRDSCSPPKAQPPPWKGTQPGQRARAGGVLGHCPQQGRRWSRSLFQGYTTLLSKSFSLCLSALPHWSFTTSSFYFAPPHLLCSQH